MKFRRTERQRATEENLVPLINIVFLILIFFLVASTIRPFSDRDITLAESRETTGAGPVQRAVLVRGDGTFLIAGDVVLRADLPERLRAWAAEPHRPVTIVADRTAAADQVVELVTAASAAGLTSVKLLTRRMR